MSGEGSGQGQGGHGRSVSLPTVRGFTTQIRPPVQPPATPPSTADGPPTLATLPSEAEFQTVTLSPTQPASRVVGLPQHLPAPIMGAEDMAAGDWCKFILTSPFPFSVALSGHKLKGKLLGKMLNMPGKNEPVLRPGWRIDWDATKFFTRINSSLANVEAVVMQCVGNVITDPEKMCETCSTRKGPFAFCVTVGGIEECANCHWDREEHRCSFNTNPSTPKSRRSSKLYTQAEILEFEKEREDLRKEKAGLDAQFIAFRKQLEKVGQGCRTALRSHPERLTPPVPVGEMAAKLDSYRRELEGRWLWDVDSLITTMQTDFGLIGDKTRDIIERQDVLTTL
ncbi:uncharacterized protein N7503_008018 [Penicillium pulvis]|uniref:uncharacterized protein n=1 Tax=Penicillium pulvis TaxID=1562058 RepID=UPI002548F6BA|nr:uncharacterized protein N7503_008018 [Penicillium pulvis]KAJ5792040.1 hypothetical protein N7503_008018 [Penicillium pulvis]